MALETLVFQRPKEIEVTIGPLGLDDLIDTSGDPFRDGGFLPSRSAAQPLDCCIVEGKRYASHPKVPPSKHHFLMRAARFQYIQSGMRVEVAVPISWAP